MDRSEERHYSLSVPSSSFKIMKMYIGVYHVGLFADTSLPHFQFFCSHIMMPCISCVFHKSLKKAFARVELLLITSGYGFELHEIYLQFSSSENLF